MELIVAEGHLNRLYDSQFSMVHMNTMHCATETFNSRMDGCWKQRALVSLQWDWMCPQTWASLSGGHGTREYASELM